MRLRYFSTILLAVALTPVTQSLLALNDRLFAQEQSFVAESTLPDSTKSSVSNVLKTKHDTVKNSINNVR